MFGTTTPVVAVVAKPRAQFLNQLIDSASILVLTAALFFALGVAEHHGFLLTLSLDPDVLERSTHRLIYSGFFLVLINLNIGLLTVLPVLLLVLSATLVLYFVPRVRLWFAGVRFRRVYRQRPGSSFMQVVDQQVNRILNTFVFTTALLLGLSLMLYWAESEGKHAALRLLNPDPTGERSQRRIHVDFPGGQKRVLMPLRCGEKVCAAMQIETREIVYYPLSERHSMLVKKPATPFKP